MLIPLLEAVPSIAGLAGRPRKRPTKLHVDKAYASRAHRAWLRSRGIAPRIACYGLESRERLGNSAGWSNTRWADYTASADYASATSPVPIGLRQFCLSAKVSDSKVAGRPTHAWQCDTASNISIINPWTNNSDCFETKNC